MSIKNMALGWQHIGIPVKDMEESIKFYAAIGFENVYATMNGKEKVTFMRMGNMTVELYTNEDIALRAGAIDHICINVSDIDAAFQTIKNGTFKLLDDGVNYLPFWENGVRFFTLEGPNMEKIEFSQYL